jgi:transcriptional regulator with XRE-family HTH domain
MPDYSHLGDAIQRRARELGLDQEALVTRSGMGRTTVQRLWSGKLVHEPSRRTKQDTERVLQWAPGSFDDATEGREPTPLEAPAADAEREPTTPDRPGKPSLPLRVQLAMKEGQLLDYDVLEFEVGGRPLSFIAFAQTGAYGTDEEMEALREQLDAFRRMMERVRQEGESAGDVTPDQ